MNKESKSSIDEFEIAKTLGLKIKEKDIPDMTAFLMPEEKIIFVNKNLPEIKRKVYILHECCHYSDKNYLAKGPVSGLFAGAGKDQSILDVFYQEKRKSDERYKRLKEDLERINSEAGFEEGCLEEELQRMDAVSQRNRDATPNQLILENAHSELNTWISTEALYRAKMKIDKSWGCVEAISVCNVEIQKVCKSVIKVLEKSISNEKNRNEALRYDIENNPDQLEGLYPQVQIDLEKNLENLEELSSRRQDYLREEIFSWRRSIDISRERECSIVDEFTDIAQGKEKIPNLEKTKLEGGVVFDQIFNFPEIKASVADDLRAKLKKYFIKNDPPFPLEINLDSEGIIITLPDQQYKIGASSIVFGIYPALGSFFPQLNTTRDIIDMALQTMKVSEFIPAGFKITNFIPLPVEEKDAPMNRVIKSPFFDMILSFPSKWSAGYCQSAIKMSSEDITFEMVLTFDNDNDEWCLWVDFKSGESRKYLKRLKEFWLDCYGIYVDEMRNLKTSLA